jgi:hypothetical protein
LVFVAVSSMSEPHVDSDQRFGMVDHDRTARRQRHGARVGGLDLVLDLEPGKERHVVAVALDARGDVRHHQFDERLRLAEDVVGIDQHLADVRTVVVADGADHEARLEIDQFRRFDLIGRVGDRLPQLQQVLEVPLQFFGVASDAGGAGDHAHAGRQVKLVDRLAQFLPILALDAARDAAAARVVRHQHQVAPGERNEGRQRGALVAALLFFDLDDQFLALADHVLKAGATDVDPRLEVGPRDFLERQEAVAFFAVVDEARLQARFDPGDDTFIDVRLALFAPGLFDVEVDQLLTIDDRHPKFFGVGGVEKHPLHQHSWRPLGARVPNRINSSGASCG